MQPVNGIVAERADRVELIRGFNNIQECIDFE